MSRSVSAPVAYLAKSENKQRLAIFCSEKKKWERINFCGDIFGSDTAAQWAKIRLQWVHRGLKIAVIHCTYRQTLRIRDVCITSNYEAINWLVCLVLCAHFCKYLNSNIYSQFIYRDLFKYLLNLPLISTSVNGFFLTD